MSEHIKLDRAYMERGLLCIDLHEEIPNELQPVKVTIFIRRYMKKGILALALVYVFRA